MIPGRLRALWAGTALGVLLAGTGTAIAWPNQHTRIEVQTKVIPGPGTPGPTVYVPKIVYRPTPTLTAPTGPARPITILYTVQPGDNLTKIAGWFRTHEGYQGLYADNLKQLVHGPDVLPVGLVLRVQLPAGDLG